MRDSLILSDGRSFDGTRFGSPTTVVGEAALYTGVVGWQEVLTDPAYAGKIVVFTYPHVGNYGVNDVDVESSAATVTGIVVRDLARFHSNFRAKGSFLSWVEEQGIAGLTGVDTRAVMVHARDHGIGVGAIASGEQEGLQAIRTVGSPFDQNLVAKIQGICRMPREDVGAGGPAGPSFGVVDAALTPWTCQRAYPRPSQGERGNLRLAVLDLGGKYSLYRQLLELGCALRFFAWDTSAEMVMASGCAGLLLPPGPGDPQRLAPVVEQVRRLVGRLPILGIGLGFQLLAMALGARVIRLKAGRHGVNYPIRSTRGEPSLIAACHHSFAMDAGSVPAEVEVTYVHLNEGTPMGLEAKGMHAWGYQFHPGRDGDNRPSPLLARFVEALPRSST